MEWNWRIYCFTCVSVRLSVRTQYLDTNISKRFELEAWYQLPTNRKWPMADRMMTLSMMSHDIQSQGRDPNIFKARYFENGSR